MSISLSFFLISFFSSEDIHGFSLCLTSIVLRGILSLAIVRNLSIKLIQTLLVVSSSLIMVSQSVSETRCRKRS